MLAKQYCLFYCATFCYSLTEWKDIALMFAAYIAAPGAIFTAYKTYKELKKSHADREKELLLKRIEFTLNQHRRLFDDDVLYSVLCLIDGDDLRLTEEKFWDPKRKFLTFFEEISLLINSHQIDASVAYYLFGYYAKCAKDGNNFKTGIKLDEKYWGLFYKFAEDAEAFLRKCDQSPDLVRGLRF